MPKTIIQWAKFIISQRCYSVMLKKCPQFICSLTQVTMWPWFIRKTARQVLNQTSQALPGIHCGRHEVLFKTNVSNIPTTSVIEATYWFQYPSIKRLCGNNSIFSSPFGWCNPQSHNVMSWWQIIIYESIWSQRKHTITD